jgi:ParB family chromosome partitioning protein
MERTIELRIVDPKILTYADKRDPRQIPADRLSDAALKANTNAIGFVQPPLFSEHEDGTLTIIAGRRRIKSAVANKLTEMAILVKPADPLDDMRAVAENVVRAPMSPVDLWRAIEDLAAKNWTEEAIATAFAVPLRQVRKLRLLGALLPAMLEHMGRGDMPEERYLRAIACAPLSEQAAVWTKQKPKKGQTAQWYAIANSLTKRQVFARDAKFGEKEEAAFGIVWIEDLFAPADEDSRYTTDVDAFLGAQLAWLEANVPKNGEIVQVDDYGAAKLPKGATRVWGGKPGKKDRVALSVDPRNGAVSEVRRRDRRGRKAHLRHGAHPHDGDQGSSDRAELPPRLWRGRRPCRSHRGRGDRRRRRHAPHGDRGVPFVPVTRRARGRGQPTPRPPARPGQGHPGCADR